MKRTGKKGQGAMEYLMTYGWAILVVMIVGVVLWQLGIFGGQGGSNKALGFSGGKIGAIDATIKCTTTELNVTMTNQAGTSLSNIIVTATGDYDAGGAAAVVGFGAAAGTTLNSGKNAAMAIDTSATLTSGDKTTTDVSIAFDERVAGQIISRTQSGVISCTVE